MLLSYHVKNNLYWSRQRNMLSRLDDSGEWQKIESSQNIGKHGIKVLDFHYLGKNGTQTWKQFKPGICRSTASPIREHDSSNHIMKDARIFSFISHGMFSFWLVMKKTFCTNTRGNNFPSYYPNVTGIQSLSVCCEWHVRFVNCCTPRRHHVAPRYETNISV